MPEASSPEIPFNPEIYSNTVIHVVHPESFDRILDGKKQADISTINDARRIKKHFAALQEIATDEKKNITIRIIDNPSIFQLHPDEQGRQIIVGGAFDQQCIADYEKAANQQGIQVKVDSLLTLRLD